MKWWVEKREAIVDTAGRSADQRVLRTSSPTSSNLSAYPGVRRIAGARLSGSSGIPTHHLPGGRRGDMHSCDSGQVSGTKQSGGSGRPSSPYAVRMVTRVRLK